MPVTPNPGIVVNCLVRNEERWIWYALQSVINHVDKILVWDTGSTDSTVEIIRSISDPKISFKEIGTVDTLGFTKARQQMLEESGDADWIMLLDGDEIWTDQSMREVRQIINNGKSRLDIFTHKYANLLGDVYHFQNPAVGRYHIGPYSGNITVRIVNNKTIKGLHFDLPYGKEGLFDGSGTPIQNRSPLRTVLCEHSYLHATHLSRSSKDRSVMQRIPKYKFELGRRFPNNFSYPASFYLPRPPEVRSPWGKRSCMFTLVSAFLSPFIIIKRLFQ